MDTKLKDIRKQLVDSGIKPTYQRIRILQFLYENKIHPTAEMIYESLIDEMPSLSRTTVYNTFNSFIENKFVMPLTITGTEIRVDVCLEPHHHFLCEKCGKIIDIDISCPNFKIGNIQGNKIKEMHGYFKGICKDCLKN